MNVLKTKNVGGGNHKGLPLHAHFLWLGQFLVVALFGLVSYIAIVFVEARKNGFTT